MPSTGGTLANEHPENPKNLENRRTVLHFPPSTSIVNSRDPEIAESIGTSHSPTVALRIGEKLPPLRSLSSTDSTEGGSAVMASPLTTAPGVPVRRRT